MMRRESLQKVRRTLPRPQPLPLDKRLYHAGQHVVRARLFLDLWFYFEGKTTRAKIIGTMRRYNEFFRFTPHAYFVAYVRPRLIVIGSVFRKDSSKVLDVEHEQMIRAVAPENSIH